MPADVFEYAPSEGGAELTDDTLDVRPKVSLVVLAFALPSLAERLAWVSGNEGVDRSGKWSGVECGDIIPDWRWIEVSRLLGCDKHLLGVGFVFDVDASSKPRFREVQSHVEATAACT